MIEIQDIFDEFGKKYCDEHNLPFQLRKAIMNMISCRTAALGGHVDECDKCGRTRISYNSCRDRHCPKCQTLSKERWIEKRKEELLTIPYFRVVFTIPHELEFLTQTNKKEWVVYCKPPFGSAEHVIEYLGRYTHRVAISNNRIVAFENGLVVFKWKDYRDNSKEKHMTVTTAELLFKLTGVVNGEGESLS